ncbi:hypothetical protein B0H13DRAFT_1889955 [Mycena leptocephala]|nr:hypothetical protein B0H13DRAFT_1889955 [Mycena leptocephala]
MCEFVLLRLPARIPVCGTCAHGQVPVPGAGAPACVGRGYPGALLARDLLAKGEAGVLVMMAGKAPQVRWGAGDWEHAYRLGERELRACAHEMAMAQIRMLTCGVDVSACDGMGLVHDCARTPDVCDDRASVLNAQSTRRRTCAVRRAWADGVESRWIYAAGVREAGACETGGGSRPMRCWRIVHSQGPASGGFDGDLSALKFPRHRHEDRMMQHYPGEMHHTPSRRLL